MKETAVNHIKRQPFFGESKQDQEALDKLYGLIAKSSQASSGKKKDLLYKTVIHVLTYTEKNGCVPAYLKMDAHHWRELRQSTKNSGIATHKLHEGRRFAGIPVEIGHTFLKT